MPKYAYLVPIERPESAGFGKRMRMWGHEYGEIYAVVNDVVKERTVFQYGNSRKLRSLKEPLKDPASITDPHLEALILGPLRYSDIEAIIIRKSLFESLKNDLQTALAHPPACILTPRNIRANSALQQRTGKFRILFKRLKYRTSNRLEGSAIDLKRD